MLYIMSTVTLRQVNSVQAMLLNQAVTVRAKQLIEIKPQGFAFPSGTQSVIDDFCNTEKFASQK